MITNKRVYAKVATSWYENTKKILASNLFFRLTLALFVLQAGVIAVRGGFPLAFDEGYHLGIIQLHATQLGPFFSDLPNWTGKYGALVTDPSYLYHYLISFPYRIITTFTDNTFVTILVLRFLNISLFVLGIVLFKKVLGYTGASRALVNLVLLAFVILPLEPFTAAQINYDNLLFPVTAAALLFCLKFSEKLRYSKQFDVTSLVLTVSICLLGTQVKYVFFPIFLAITLFLFAIIGHWIYAERRDGLNKIRTSIATLSNRTKYTLLILLVVSAGLFTYRFGYNMVNYRSVAPDCSKVLSVETCMQYGPWARNYQLGQAHTPHASWAEQKAFIKTWIYMVRTQLFSMLSSDKGAPLIRPINQLILATNIIIALGFVLLLLQWRRIREIDHATSLIVLVSGMYLAALLTRNYNEYIQYGVPVAIQGRYLLPVLLLLIVLLAQVYSTALKSRPDLKIGVLGLLVVLGVYSGGLTASTMRVKHQTWQWKNTATVSIKDQ